MKNNEELINNILEQIPFSPISQLRLANVLKEEVSDQELFLALSKLVEDGKIMMNMGIKGPEYSRKWNTKVDEERKAFSKELNTRFDENVIFFPRFEGYVANIKDNIIARHPQEILKNFCEIGEDYVYWHKNNKSGLVYPPKLNAANSSDVFAVNIISGLGVDDSQIQYAVEFEALAKEAFKDRPEEISAPKAFFDAAISYNDAIDFVQGHLIDSFYQPVKPGLWAYQYGDRYLFDDEEAINLFRDFSKKIHAVYFDITDLIKTIVALYSDILASSEDYINKKVNILSINYLLKEDTKYQVLYNYQEHYLKEAHSIEEKVNELLAKLNLPEGVSMEYQFLTIDDVIDNLSEDAKAYIEKRYLNL